jgi:quinol monooxygenase YgiN
MAQTALFVRHRAKPGMREEVRRVWEKHVRPRAATNPNHLAYYFCYDDNDPDVVCVFQLFSHADATAEFLAGDWYPIYLAEVGAVVADPPHLTTATLVWAKSPAEAG